MKTLLRLYRTPVLLLMMRVGGAGAAIVLNLVLARTMSPAELGFAMTLQAVAMLSSFLASGAMESGAVRFLSRYRADDRLDLARGFIRANRIAVLSLGTVLLVAGTAVLIVRMTIQGTAFPWPFLVALCTAVVVGWQRVSAAHAMALSKVLWSVLPNTFLRQVLHLGLVVLWVSLFGPPSVLQVVILLFFAVMVSMTVQYLAIRPHYAVLGTGPANMDDVGSWTRVGLQIGSTLIFVEFNRQLALIFAALSLDRADVAKFGIAMALIGLAKFAVVAVNQSMTPKLAGMIARSETDAAVRLIHTANHMKVWPLLAGAVILWFIGGDLLAIFGNDYRAAAPILTILMIEPLVFAAFGPGSNYVSFSESQRVLVPIALGSATIQSLGILVGGHVAGLTGTAVGFVCAWIFWSVTLAIYVRRRYGINITIFARRSK